MDALVPSDSAQDLGGQPDVTLPFDAATDAPPPDLSTPRDMRAPCTPFTCAALGEDCGQHDDGCGGTVDCGVCAMPVDCSGIERAPNLELCTTTATTCAGVYTAGGDCHDFCAAAGLACVFRHGGGAGCSDEGGADLGCGNPDGHVSDWCECEGEGMIEPPDPTCPGTPTTVAMDWHMGNYTPRTSWVLSCRDYAFTAVSIDDFRRACRTGYEPGSGRGIGTFTFNGVAPGRYEVIIRGRHTENRNPAGALFHVDSGGMRHSDRVNQRTASGGFEDDTLGTYCLGGTVVVTLDSSGGPQSDSVNRVTLQAR